MSYLYFDTLRGPILFDVRLSLFLLVQFSLKIQTTTAATFWLCTVSHSFLIWVASVAKLVTLALVFVTFVQ